jgi:hypothetical protein
MTAGYLLNPDGTVSNSSHDNQGTDLTYRYTERAGDQTFRAFTYEGFRYLQIGAPASDVAAVVQHTDVPDQARLRTSDAGVDAAYDLMMRSALYDSQEQFLDTPTREKGQFLGDTVDVSLATMAGYGERRLTRKAIREFVASQARYWPDGRLNAVYPNGDGARDIPDYTEMFPGWVWSYYLQSGDVAVVGGAADRRQSVPRLGLHAAGRRPAEPAGRDGHRPGRRRDPGTTAGVRADLGFWDGADPARRRECRLAQGRGPYDGERVGPGERPRRGRPAAGPRPRERRGAPRGPRGLLDRLGPRHLHRELTSTR